MWKEYLDPQIAARDRWATVAPRCVRYQVGRPRLPRRGFGGRGSASGPARRIVSGALRLAVVVAVLAGCEPTWSTQAPAPAHPQIAPVVLTAERVPTTL